METGSGYIRLSDDSEEESTGGITQGEDLRALAASHGIELLYLRVDDGKSGELRSRKEYDLWLADATERGVQNLLAWKFDRVTRAGLAGLVRFYDALEGKDANGKVVRPTTRFLSFQDRMDSNSPAWTIQSYVMAGLAKSELDTIKSRVRRSREYRKAQGRFLGGVVPVGFRKERSPDHPGFVLVVDEAESEILLAAARRVVAGDTMLSVIRYMHESLPPRRAAQWSSVTVRATLLKECNKEFMGPALRRALRQRLVEEVGPHGGRAPARLLSGLLHCTSCGRAMTVTGSAQTRGYRCPNALECPRPVSVMARRIEECVLDLWHSGWGQLAMTEKVRVADLRAAEITRLEDATAEAQEALGRASSREVRLEIMEALDGLEEALRAAQAEPATQTVLYRETGRTWGQAFAGAPMDERRELLRKTLGSITVSHGQRGIKRFDPDRLAFGAGMVLGPRTAALGGSSPLV